MPPFFVSATMAKFDTLPGFREFYPEDFAQRKFIFQTWRHVSRHFGFQEFDGPILESLDLFKAKSGEEIESQLFCFADKGGREVSLRPELTPSLARMVSARASALRRPIKWFSVGDNFRYERQQRGRLRCFSQFNADILGEASPSADVELIALVMQTLLNFGLDGEDFQVRLSDRQLWVTYLEAVGLPREEVGAALSIIDKWERVPEEKSRAALRELAGGEGERMAEAIAAFLAVDSLDGIREQFAAVGAEGGDSLERRLEEWRQLLGGLAAMGYGDLVSVDLAIVRGLAYYTGFVFEAFDRKGAFRAIAGGGRYDQLIEKMGGPAMPAVGFGMGDVVLAEILRERGKMPRFMQAVDIYVVIGGEREREVALRDIGLLRRAGLMVDYPLKDQGFGKQFKAASGAGARFALVYGSDELERGQVKLRNMATREEEEIPRDRVVSAVRDRLDG